MWTSTYLELDSRTTATTLSDGSHELSFREVIGLWREDPVFRAWFTQRLRESPFDAYYWELPPVTAQTLDRTLEYVLIDAPGFIGLSADAEPFRVQFAARGDAEVLTFPNLRGDAMLVVPAPVSPANCYMHLAHFVRRAPEAQVDTLWKAVGDAMQARVSERPVWLSTAGTGVSWLHVRLDSRPKYYRHGRYTVPPGAA
jgi:hypothetical protein